MSQSHLHLRSELSKCQKWKASYTMIDALVTVSTIVSPYLLSLKHWTYEPPKIRPTCCPRPSEAKSYDGSWSRTVKICTITNYKVTDILIWLMETLAVWLSGWAADPPGQNWRGAGSSCKLLAFLWTEDWKRLHRLPQRGSVTRRRARKKGGDDDR